MQTEGARYLECAFPAEAGLALWVRGVVLEADPELVERVYRGWRGLGFRHPEAGYVCGVFPKDGRVELLFEHGATLPDPLNILRGRGGRTRFIRAEQESEHLQDAISVYVRQAVAQRLLDRVR